MSGIVNFNAQIASLEHVEKVVRQEQEHALVKGEALMQSATRLLSRDNEAVQKTEGSPNGRKVERRRADDEGGRKKGSGFAKKDGGPDGQPDVQADDEALLESAQTGVWSGNIVNIKV